MIALRKDDYMDPESCGERRNIVLVNIFGNMVCM